jgi:hypothetical protein
MIQDISAAQLRKAAAIKDRIDSLQTELTKILGSPEANTRAVKTTKKRTFSAATRAKMRASQQARWANVKPAKK